MDDLEPSLEAKLATEGLAHADCLPSREISPGTGFASCSHRWPDSSEALVSGPN